MFDIAFLILFCVMAVRIAKSISREAAIFREFKQSRMLAILVFLFPIGPIMLFAGPRFFGSPLQFLASAACFVPALMVARRNNRVFGSAGTDRVKKAKNAVSEAFSTALGGLIYVCVMFVISTAAILINR